jgi:hypothetical protein
MTEENSHVAVAAYASHAWSTCGQKHAEALSGHIMLKNRMHTNPHTLIGHRKAELSMVTVVLSQDLPKERSGKGRFPRTVSLV